MTARGQWTPISSGTTLNLKQIAFADSLNGFIIAGSSPSVLLRTTNGGFNWTPVLTNYNFASVYFLNPDTGAVLGKDTIYKTFDGGNSWTMIATTTAPFFPVCLFHMNDVNEWIFVHGQFWGFTQDGGNTWTDSSLGNAGILPLVTTDFQFINDTTVIGIGWYHSLTFISTNKGLHWSQLGLFPGGTGGYKWSVCFVSQTIGFATGSYHTYSIYKSVNGGINWNIIDSTLGFGINCIRNVDGNNLYGVGTAGGIAKTSDGGQSWITDVSPTTNNLNKIIFINSHTAIAIGDTGTIIMNTTIATGITTLHSTDNLISVFPNPSNNILSIENNSSTLFQFTLYNSLGEKLFEKTLINKKSTIDLSAFSNAVYFYKVSNDGQVIKSGKIIKQ